MLAAAHGCTTAWARDTGLVTVLGRPADRHAVQRIYPSLLRKAMQTMRLEVPRRRDLRRAFLRSFAQQAGERLEATR